MNSPRDVTRGAPVVRHALVIRSPLGRWPAWNLRVMLVLRLVRFRRATSWFRLAGKRRVPLDVRLTRRPTVFSARKVRFATMEVSRCKARLRSSGVLVHSARFGPPGSSGLAGSLWVHGFRLKRGPLNRCGGLYVYGSLDRVGWLCIFSRARSASPLLARG